MTFARETVAARDTRNASRKAANLRSLATPSRTLHRATLAVFDGVAKPVEKEHPARSEAYRRLVAAMPCASCRYPGPSQAAHANQGKGMAIKTDDRTCFPLCTRCHRLHDQAAFTTRDQRREMELRWGHQTRIAIANAGTWPKNLPLWSEKP